MKNLSVISAIRAPEEKFCGLMDSIAEQSTELSDIEVLVVIDDDDIDMLKAASFYKQKYERLSLEFFSVPQSDHFSKDYWNFLAKKAQGRFIIPMGADNKILTKGWDDIIYTRMDQAAKKVGDDIVHGLTRDNIKRRGEDINYPHFSCNPVLSKEHVNALGYFFDERYWSWGADQAISLLYRTLFDVTKEWRLVSLIDVKIYAFDSMHTTDEEDETKLDAMRKADMGYQKHLRIALEHPCTLTSADYINEALKLRDYIERKRSCQK